MTHYITLSLSFSFFSFLLWAVSVLFRPNPRSRFAGRLHVRQFFLFFSFHGCRTSLHFSDCVHWYYHCCTHSAVQTTKIATEGKIGMRREGQPAKKASREDCCSHGAWHLSFSLLLFPTFIPSQVFFSSFTLPPSANLDPHWRAVIIRQKARAASCCWSPKFDASGLITGGN